MALAGEVSRWLAATQLSHTIQTVTWVIPAVQTIHILGVAAAFSSAVLVNLRIFGLFERAEPLRDVIRRFLPPIWPILVVLLLTGSILIVGEPRRSLVNSIFYIKMTLLLAAITLTAILQAWLAAPSSQASGDPWEKDRIRRMAGRALAALSLLVWCGILFAGRWIAYTQTG